MPLGIRPGRRARASQRRLSPYRILALAVLAVALSELAGGVAYFLPAAVTAFSSTGQVVNVPSPTPSLLFTPSPSPSPVALPNGAFTVLLLGSDDDSKFYSDHVLTQSMILVRVEPATKQVIMLSIPRDLYVPLSVGGTAVWLATEKVIDKARAIAAHGRGGKTLVFKFKRKKQYKRTIGHRQNFTRVQITEIV